MPFSYEFMVSWFMVVHGIYSMVTTKKFKITDMHCTSCALSIDMELEEQEGVVESNTSYAKQETEVKFDGGKINEDKIIEIIKNVGYTAEPFHNRS